MAYVRWLWPLEFHLFRPCSVIICGLDKIGKKIIKDFNLFEIETQLIPHNPRELTANQASPYCCKFQPHPMSVHVEKEEMER